MLVKENVLSFAAKMEEISDKILYAQILNNNWY